MNILRVWVGLTLLCGLGLTGCATMTDTEVLSQDAHVQSEVLNRLRQDAITESIPFGVTVSGGVVTLRGSVPDEITRHRAVSVVRGTPGVVRIDDRLMR